ncbi:hypothetical protein JG688_00018631 [Phytophthora aleatoria]|uniref:Uncharacterized protein n=1 Tax=Phytophthora aleatoria TaxID=2496075 RepID=A0A8J5HZA9_9STRA|nr:hypothetical protein JG688_00018631 [Phytophthora aleatoria]
MRASEFKNNRSSKEHSLRRSTRYKTWPNPPRRTATIVAYLSAGSFGAVSVATSLKIFQMWTSPSFGGKFLLRF